MLDQADIHRKVVSDDVKERREAVDQLRDNFVDLLDKKGAWEDLIRLTQDDYRWSVRCWHNIKNWLTLTWNEDSVVRWRAVDALGSAFQYVPDKDVAWEDLIWLIWNKDSVVRWDVAGVLGSAFQYVSDKDKAWEDLIQLTGEEDRDVRVFANYSLGRVSIFKATEAESEKDFRKYLKDSVEFFGKTKRRHVVQRADNLICPKTKPFIYYSDPSEFCLPFYRSFYAITFGKAEAKGEVEKYLSEAKSASKGSENKETLLEAVENLASALSEAHKVTDFDVMKSDLRTYRRYCDRAADLIGDAAEAAPGATRVLRRGLPIIDQRIKELLEEVKKKSESICKAADLPESELGCRIGQHAATALATDTLLILEREIDHILNDLERWSHSIRDENEKGYVQGIIFDAKDGDTRGKASSIRVLLGRLLTFTEDRGEMSKYDFRGSTIQIAEGNGNVQKMDSSVNSRKVETGSGDVTVTHGATVTEELPPEKHRIDQQKRTAIEIFADVTVHVLVYTVLHHYLEELMSVIAPILVFSALIILILIIRNAKSR